MPEIWLKYGTTNVVLDIKFENLLSHISSNFQSIPQQEIMDIIRSIRLTDNTLILALSESKAAAKVAMMLTETAHMQGFPSITIDVPTKFAGAFRTDLTTIAGRGDPVSINRIDYESLEERMKKFQKTVVISNVAYDPLFGFAGAPTRLLRNLYTDEMTEAFKARRENKPLPGIEDRPLKIAMSATESIQASTTSIELVVSSTGIAGIHVGSIVEAFNKAIEQLKSISVAEIEPAKCAIISASNESNKHSTLTDSLNSLWNSMHAIKEGGSAILLAENREGVGGGALQMFIEGRLKIDQLYQIPYIAGLEHLIYMEEMRKKYELGLVSTIPYYYSKIKLGFTTYEGAKNILDKLVERHGKNFKSIILSDPDIILLKPKV